ncbi:MAG: DNA polymerase I, partial [Desulfobacterales bacterium]
MRKEKTIYLIDGTAYIHRAYHAIRGLSNSKGLPTNATFGFTRMLLKLIEDRNPQYAGMFFDAKGPTFRHEMFAEYKANRPPMPDDMTAQIPYIKKMTAAFQLPIIEMQGFEADDLIGTYARIAE